MATIQTMKTAVIGCGMISHVYIRNLLHRFSMIDLVALGDVVEAAAREKLNFMV